MNTKVIFCSIFFLVANSVTAQSRKVRFVNKVGDTLVGYGRIFETEYDEIFEFKETPLAKTKKYYLYNIDFHEFFDKDDFELDEIRIGGGTEGVVSASVLYRGKVNLYMHEIKHLSYADFGVNGIIHRGGGTSQNYYIKKDKDPVPVFVYGKSTLSFGKSFRKTAMEYFKDCDELVEKIRKREFKRKHLIEIVYFYDKKCN
uniref:hypothetical protein n=1 Tax=uncultured Croceitalea sp. TaxID=1798908 RepID=UPI003305A725